MKTPTKTTKPAKFDEKDTTQLLSPNGVELIGKFDGAGESSIPGTSIVRTKEFIKDHGTFLRIDALGLAFSQSTFLPSPSSPLKFMDLAAPGAEILQERDKIAASPLSSAQSSLDPVSSQASPPLELQNKEESMENKENWISVAPTTSLEFSPPVALRLPNPDDSPASREIEYFRQPGRPPDCDPSLNGLNFAVLGLTSSHCTNLRLSTSSLFSSTFSSLNLGSPTGGSWNASPGKPPLKAVFCGGVPQNERQGRHAKKRIANELKKKKVFLMVQVAGGHSNSKSGSPA
jgi:hypothetical protein